MSMFPANWDRSPTRNTPDGGSWFGCEGINCHQTALQGHGGAYATRSIRGYFGLMKCRCILPVPHGHALFHHFAVSYGDRPKHVSRYAGSTALPLGVKTD